MKQRKRREETESGGETERFGRNPVCQRAPPFCFVFLLVSLWAKDETSQTPGQLQTASINLKSVGSRPPFCDVSRE